MNHCVCEDYRVDVIEYMLFAVDFFAQVAKMVDALGLNPGGPCDRAGSTPALGTTLGDTERWF